MGNRSNYFYILIFTMVWMGGFFPDASRAEEDAGSFSENEFSPQGKSVSASPEDETQPNRPFMSLKEIQVGKPKPTEKELAVSSGKNIDSAKVPEKQPNWFVKTFWLSLRGWINEKNRNDPNNDRSY